MKKQLYDILERCLSEKRLAEIYLTTDEHDCFELGIPLAVSDEGVVILSFDKKGDRDGAVYFPADNIYRVCDNDIYIDRCRDIIRIFDKKYDIEYYNGEFSDNNCSAEAFLEFAHRKNNIVSVMFGGSDFYDIEGFVKEVGDGCAVILEIDKYGKAGGIDTIDTDDIIYISAGSRDAVIRQALYNDKTKGTEINA